MIYEHLFGCCFFVYAAIPADPTGVSAFNNDNLLFVLVERIETRPLLDFALCEGVKGDTTELI